MWPKKSSCLLTTEGTFHLFGMVKTLECSVITFISLFQLLQELYSSPQLKNSCSHFKYAATKWQSCKGRLIWTWESWGAAWVGGRVLPISTVPSTDPLKAANLTVTQSYISLVSGISPLRIKVLRNGNIYTYEARLVLFKVIVLYQW